MLLFKTAALPMPLLQGDSSLPTLQNFPFSFTALVSFSPCMWLAIFSPTVECLPSPHWDATCMVAGPQQP